MNRGKCQGYTTENKVERSQGKHEGWEENTNQTTKTTDLFETRVVLSGAKLTGRTMTSKHTLAHNFCFSLTLLIALETDITHTQEHFRLLTQDC